MTKRCIVLGIFLWIALALPGVGQMRETEHTFRYSQADPKPKSSLQRRGLVAGRLGGDRIRRRQ